MSRPTKRSETINVPLEIVSGKLASLSQFNHRLTRLRVEQAIHRHPDLKGLLEPILEELKEHGHSVEVARHAVSTVKRLLNDEL